MIRPALRAVGVFGLLSFGSLAIAADPIPRPEHPTPDAVRPHWSNLNGTWDFRFDPNDEGKKADWFKPGAEGFKDTIVVPFPWESALSKIKRTDYRGVAWYRRTVEIPASFPKDQRVWLHFGAVDWEADVWVNGTHVAHHEGGYSPFAADITDALKADRTGVVVVRAFDPTDPSLPTGKQVGWYTPSSGIWQTVWLESRPKAFIRGVTTRTEIAPARAAFAVDIHAPAAGKYTLALKAKDASVRALPVSVEADGAGKPLSLSLGATVDDAKLWTPEAPHLYEVTLELTAPDGSVDTLATYFGLRTIARGKYGDAAYERILLNGKPVYLRLALDQSFNPEGLYTAPDDDFLKRDLILAKFQGLNGLRIHIKPDEPRRLYWADRIGLLILEDMPNTWRQNPRARAAWESTAREVVARDRNHPSIITWVAFNETWGLGTPPAYKRDTDTQRWVNQMVDVIRKLDPTRLVEDNSPCNYDHVANTDLNSWHFYIDEHNAAERHVADVVRQTEPGSVFNYCPGVTQSTAPLINSEYGGVSAGGGDRDVSWCFRDLTTILRRQPKIQGYVYTELTDIEWEHNGFANYDRSLKEFGYGQFLPDMRPNELNGADFIGYGGPPAVVVKPGETVTVPVFISHFSERDFKPAVRWWVAGWDEKAQFVNVVQPNSVPATWKAYDVVEQTPLTFTAPKRGFVGSINITLRDEKNQRWAANFVNVVVRPEQPAPRVARESDHEATLRFAPGDFSQKQWSGPSASPAGKVHGQGKGYYEYALSVPAAIAKADPQRFFFRAELASRAGRGKVDWPERRNGQDYPQTDARKWPSTVALVLGGVRVDTTRLPDDPADALGVLSHLKRFEHGSHGELVEFEGKIPDSVRQELKDGKPLRIRLEVPSDAIPAGGLTIFGAHTGAYPFDPSITLECGEDLPKDLGVDPAKPITTDRAAERSVRILSPGDADRPTTWSYTTRKPPADWHTPGFRPEGWQDGRSGFGTDGTPGVRVATEWNTPQIWIVTRVTLPKIGPDDDLILRYFHDEDVEILVNGQLLVRARGYVTDYREQTLDPAQKALFHEGANTVAVTCRQTGGGQGLDVGLTLNRVH